jgi:hypothetical protein
MPTQKSVLTYNSDKKFLKENMYCFKLSDVPDVNVTGRKPNIRVADERFVNYPMGTKIVLFPETNFTGTGVPLIKFGMLNSTMMVRSIMIDRTKLRKPFVLCRDDAAKDCSFPIKRQKSTRNVVYENIHAIYSTKKQVTKVARVVPGPVMSDLAQARDFMMNLLRQAQSVAASRNTPTTTPAPAPQSQPQQHQQQQRQQQLLQRPAQRQAQPPPQAQRQTRPTQQHPAQQQQQQRQGQPQPQGRPNNSTNPVKRFLSRVIGRKP